MPPTGRLARGELLDALGARAAEVDRSGVLAPENVHLLAEAGCYGAFAPSELGGLGLDLPGVCALVEELSAACLSTAFVLIQHFGLLGALLNPDAPAALRAMAPSVINGEVKGGIALAGLLPGPARLVATRVNEGWSLEGETPWASGWGYVDLLLVAARTTNEEVVSLLVDARDQPGLRATRHRLAALEATATVRLDFEGLVVSDDGVLGLSPFDPTERQREGLRPNGSLALGVARRCAEHLEDRAVEVELVQHRAALDDATVDTMARARAGAAAFALRVAAMLSVSRGSRSALAGDLAERSTREAALLLVFGSRPAIKTALMEELREGSGRP